MVVRVDVSLSGHYSIDIAQTAFTVLHRCMGLDVKWEETDQLPWEGLARKAMKAIDAMILDESSLSFSEMARRLFGWAYGEDALEGWEHLAPEVRSAWEAVARHLVNCLDSEVGAIKLADHEDKAVKWFHRRMSDHGVPA